jgi:membrane protein required for beta-lactamase induction
MKFQKLYKPVMISLTALMFLSALAQFAIFPVQNDLANLYTGIANLLFAATLPLMMYTRNKIKRESDALTTALKKHGFLDQSGTRL